MGGLLGLGTYGEVRLCTHIKSQAQRAVKMINRDILPNLDEEQMLREVNILKSLDHPNILKIFEVFGDEKRLYIVTELI